MGFLPILDVIGKIVDNVVPDPDKKMEMKIELAKLADAEAARESAERIAQTEVNKAEAGHSAIFVAGWRPAVGWTCGLALGYNTILAPAFGWGVADLGFLQTILLGMLGIAGMRSFDKAKGVASDVLPLPKKEDAAPVVVEKPKKKKGLDLWPF